MIPKILHFIWFGPEVPGWVQKNIEAARKLHSDWELRVWRKIPDDFPSELKMAVKRCAFVCQQADIFRYWVIYTYGGVYLDTDEIVLKSFTPLCAGSPFIGIQTNRKLACGVIGSPAKHKVMEIIIGEVKRRAPTKAPPRCLYGPFMLKYLESLLRKAGLKVYPSHYFYITHNRRQCHAFWGMSEVARKRQIELWKPFCTDGVTPYGVHLWGVEGSTKRRVR
jgi:mannosyltransferase OCH1-like enzyme